MLDLFKLRVFLHVADSLSFTQTAQHLHISQPTVSKYIYELEQGFNTNLFDRTGGRVRLTNAGKTLVPRAHQLIHQSLDLEELMNSLNSDVAGYLKIACSTTAGKYILPQLAARFCRRHPGVQITIMACAQEQVTLRLLESEADLGVVSLEVGGEHLECQGFFIDHIVLIAPAQHSWARREEIEPAELLEAPIILREPTSGTRQAMLTELARHDITLSDLDILLEVGNAEAIVSAISNGLGVAFVSRLAASCALALGTVVEIPVAGIKFHRRLCMARHSLAPPNRAQEVFWGFIHDPENRDLFVLPESSRVD
jgi:DNA-binding transcriptional LysR family regulator